MKLRIKFWKNKIETENLVLENGKKAQENNRQNFRRESREGGIENGIYLEQKEAEDTRVEELGEKLYNQKH